MQTPKQKINSKRWQLLGDVTGLPRWIGAKIPAILARPELDHITKVDLQYHAQKLISTLERAEYEIRNPRR